MSDSADHATALWRDQEMPLPGAPADHVVLPEYLERYYAWAYLDPRNARVFDTHAFLELLLFGHYRRLGNAALRAFDAPANQQLLQVGCAYGDLTPRLARQPTVDQLDVVDVAPLQLDLLQRKLPTDSGVTLKRQDATRLAYPDDHFDGVLLFFLLHELPAEAQRHALAEALRVCRPDGRVVIIDYHRPHPLQPLRWLMPLVFNRLEPFALEFWSTPIADLLPVGSSAQIAKTHYWFGSLYRQVTLTP